MKPPEECYGVWGGRAPGGWCYFSPASEGRYWGTRAEAETTLAVFKSEHPDTPYEVIPFDPDKEPEPWPCRVTFVQLRALAEIEKEGLAADWAPTSRGGFQKATYVALMERGLVMDSRRGRPALRLTRAGKAMLDKRRHELPKK